MNIEAHMAVGWAMANVLPHSSRLDRLAIMSAAMISDADGLSYLAGADAYANWHHTFGHTLFLAAPLAAAGILMTQSGRRLAVTLLILLGFASHLVGDYFLSGWELQLLWPADAWTVQFAPRIGLDHPINVWLSYASFIFMAATLWWARRTPLEFVWPRLDQLLARVTARPSSQCHVCGRRTGIICDQCGRPTCLRDALVRRGLRLVCKSCTSGRPLPAQRLSVAGSRGKRMPLRRFSHK